jgi:hypothetical protein
MSYLESPRLHFFGEFIAEPSTINNDPANFSGTIQDSGWNPNGNHRFAFADCRVVALVEGTQTTIGGDPLIGSPVTTPGSPFAKLVDLDVDAQMASTVFGLQVSVADAAGNRVRGTMTPASFRDFSGARLLGIFQSQLTSLAWAVAPTSWLAKLQAASPDVLSIRFIADLFTGFNGPHRGRLAGAIGPATVNEARHWVTGRRLVGLGRAPSALGALAGQTLTVDVGSVVGVNPGDDSFVHPTLTVAVRSGEPGAVNPDVALKTGVAPFAVAAIPPGWQALGTVPTTLERYRQTGGVESLLLSAEDAAQAAAAPLGLFTPSGDALAEEAPDGIFVFPDRQAVPMDPGDQETIELTACRFGQPATGVSISLAPTLNAGQTGISFPSTLTTGAAGTAAATITAVDPGTPRGPIDGQVFGIGGPWAAQSGIEIVGTGGAIAVRVFSGFVAPANPTWTHDVQPILGQYASLYPGMVAILDIGDFSTVAALAPDIRERLERPIEDPGHMPVTRDLSEQKRNMIVAWIDAGCPA